MRLKSAAAESERSEVEQEKIFNRSEVHVHCRLYFNRVAAQLDTAAIRLVPDDSVYELRNRLQRRGRLVTLRRVTAFGERKNLDWASGLSGDGVDLRHSSVLIIESLNRQDGAGDAREIFFDVPAAEVGMEPDVVPSPERARGVLMVAGQLCCQIGRLELDFCLGDTGDTEIFDEDVWGEQDETAHSVVGSGVDQRNGGAVTVADQDRVYDVELRQQIGQRMQGFVVHVPDRPRFSQQIGIA
jgi:hypothetical protein